MRITLAIDDDVLRAAKELARQEGRTAGEVLSELARRGLNARANVAAHRRPVLRRGVPVLAARGDVVTLEHVDRLRDEEGV